MKQVIMPLIVILHLVTHAAADVTFTELDDRIRIEIDGELFTEWRHKEWVAPFDYYGPGASGRTVGITMFDHPDNLRFPVHWHARTYGLLAANRFGTDHFDPNLKKPPGALCRPWGKGCPACESRSGDYTIPAGKSLSLRHRFYFHHGDTKAADVAKRYREYSRQPTAQDNE